MLSQLFEAHMRELLSLEDAAIARLIGPYREAQAELTQRLLELEGLGQGDTFGAQRLALMRAQLATVLAATEGRQQNELRQALQEATVRGSVQQVAEIADLERRFGELALSELVSLVQPVIPAAATAIISDASTLLISRFRNEVQYGVSQALAQSVVQGEGIAQAARRLGRTMADERWKLERIARTEIGNAMNTGHQATIEQLSSQFPEMGLQKQWSAHLDSRTSPRCRGLHLQVRETSEVFTARDGWQGMNPPSHPNCRSRVVAHSARWEATSTQKIAEQAPGTARNPLSSSAPTSADVVSASRSNRVRGNATVDSIQPPNDAELSLQRGVHFSGVSGGENVSATKRRAILRSHRPLKIEGFLSEFPFGELVFTGAVQTVDGYEVRGWYSWRTKDIVLLSQWPKNSFGKRYERGETFAIAELGENQQEVLRRTFIHELAHHIHLSLGEQFDSEIRRASSEAANNAITRGAQISWREYFAETFTAYRFERQLLQQQDPIGYNLIEKILTRIREVGNTP